MSVTSPLFRGLKVAEKQQRMTSPLWPFSRYLVLSFGRWTFDTCSPHPTRTLLLFMTFGFLVAPYNALIHCICICTEWKNETYPSFSCLIRIQNTVYSCTETKRPVLYVWNQLSIRDIVKVLSLKDLSVCVHLFLFLLDFVFHCKNIKIMKLFLQPP